MSRFSHKELCTVDMHWHKTRDTEKALCVSDHGDPRKPLMFLPRSMMVEIVEKGNSVELTMEEWYAKNKGLI